MWSFRERHEWEQGQGSFLSALWNEWWPGTVRVAAPPGTTEQRAGVDAVLTGPTFAQPFSVEVEEKIRDRDYGDMLLELDSGHGPGWSVKGARSRLLLYSIRSTLRGWVFPMQTVQRVANERGEEWAHRFGIREAKNPGYVSKNVPVPLSVFVSAIDDTHGLVFCPACRMVCEWSDLRGPSWCSWCRPRASFEIRLGAVA